MSKVYDLLTAHAFIGKHSFSEFLNFILWKAERQKYNVKVLPRWLRLYGYIIGIQIHRPKSYNYLLITKESKNWLLSTFSYVKVLLKSFHLNGNTIGLYQRTQKLERHTKKIVPFESTAEEVSFEW